MYESSSVAICSAGHCSDWLEMESELNPLLSARFARLSPSSAPPGTNGFLGGCKDRVMTFNPQKGQGDAAHFFGYLNHILRAIDSSPFSSGLFEPDNDARDPSVRSRPRYFLWAKGLGRINQDEISISYAQRFSPSSGDPAQHGLVAKLIEFTSAYNPELELLLISYGLLPDLRRSLHADIGWG